MNQLQRKVVSKIISLPWHWWFLQWVNFFYPTSFFSFSKYRLETRRKSAFLFPIRNSHLFPKTQKYEKNANVVSEKWDKLPTKETKKLIIFPPQRKGKANRNKGERQRLRDDTILSVNYTAVTNKRARDGYFAFVKYECVCTALRLKQFL